MIPLIREHAVTMKPPRALWVPFMMGRPFGVPGDSAFQKQVLRAAIALFDYPSGPILIDYAVDTPLENKSTNGWICPVSFSTHTLIKTPADNLRREIQELKSWYDLNLATSGRTTYGISGLDIDNVGQMLLKLADGEVPENWMDNVDLGEAIRLAVEDIKAFYQEAVMAQPGGPPASSTELADWFFYQTDAGKIVLKVREFCRSSDIEVLRFKSCVFVPPQYHGKGLDYF